MSEQLLIDLDFESTNPIWRQLRDALAEKAACGVLEAGYRLPPVRSFAAELDLAPGTVARVYRDLETMGIIETHGRHGTFVTTEARRVRDDQERERILRAGAEALVRAARQVGASEREAKAVFLDAYRS